MLKLNLFIAWTKTRQSPAIDRAKGYRAPPESATLLSLLWPITGSDVKFHEIFCPEIFHEIFHVMSNFICHVSDHLEAYRCPAGHFENRLQSRDPRFEILSNSNRTSRFDSIWKWRANSKISNRRACHVCRRTINNTYCSTTNFNRFGIATGIYIEFD